NVPYLSRAKQVETMRSFAETYFPASMADLATIFLEHSLRWSVSAAVVTPQSWHQQRTYEGLRRWLLDSRDYRIMARLGNNCWQNRVSNPLFKFHTVLSVISTTPVREGRSIEAIDIGDGPISEKSKELRRCPLTSLPSQQQLANPQARLVLLPQALGPLL